MLAALDRHLIKCKVTEVQRYNLSNYDPFANIEEYIDESTFEDTNQIKYLIMNFCLILGGYSHLRGDRLLTYYESLEKMIERLEKKYNFTFDMAEEFEDLKGTGSSDIAKSLRHFLLLGAYYYYPYSDNGISEISKNANQYYFETSVYDFRNREYLFKFIDRIFKAYPDGFPTMYSGSYNWIMCPQISSSNTIMPTIIVENLEQIKYAKLFFWANKFNIFIMNDDSVASCYPHTSSNWGYFFDSDNNTKTYTCMNNLKANYADLLPSMFKKNMTPDLYSDNDFVNSGNQSSNSWGNSCFLMSISSSLKFEDIFIPNKPFIYLAHHVGTSYPLYYTQSGKYEYGCMMCTNGTEFAQKFSDTYTNIYMGLIHNLQKFYSTNNQVTYGYLVDITNNKVLQTYTYSLNSDITISSSISDYAGFYSYLANFSYSSSVSIGTELKLIIYIGDKANATNDNALNGFSDVEVQEGDFIFIYSFSKEE